MRGNRPNSRRGRKGGGGGEEEGVSRENERDGKMSRTECKNHKTLT